MYENTLRPLQDIMLIYEASPGPSDHRSSADERDKSYGDLSILRQNYSENRGTTESCCCPESIFEIMSRLGYP